MKLFTIPINFKILPAGRSREDSAVFTKWDKDADGFITVEDVSNKFIFTRFGIDLFLMSSCIATR